MVSHSDQRCKLEFEHAQRLVQYAGQTFFKHLRLYDFVLKNTKLSLKKYIQIQVAEPQCGVSLNSAMIVEDKVRMIWYEE